MFAITIMGGLMQGTPDVCKTPMPPAGQPVPVPYVNIANPPLGQPTAKKVMICGSPALAKNSEVSVSNGDQPGAQGGVPSGQIMGKVSFTSSSMKVKIEGNQAVKVGDVTTHNSNNIVGAPLVPSQFKVMIMS